jgi:hypothetical protein
MYETSGVLAVVITKYLNDKELTPADVIVMRAYLRQWIAGATWTGPHIKTLRRLADDIATAEDIHSWLDIAEDAGIDPL